MNIQANFDVPLWLPIERLARVDLSHPMREIARKLETSVIQNYNQQRSPDGVPWIPSQRAPKDGGKTLIDTGRMLASLAANSGRDFAEVGYPQGDVPRWLHFGVAQNNLPAREHLGLRDTDKMMIDKTLSDYFTKLFQAA